MLRSVSHQSPLGLLWARFPFKFLRNLNTRQGRIAAHKLWLSSLRLLPSPTFKKVKSQTKKDANPEKAVRHGYDDACYYFKILNKRLLIQQRALAFLSKSLAHIHQRELYTMDNTGLLRHEAEMTLLQPNLGDSRQQELRNAPFWPSPLLSVWESFRLRRLRILFSL